MREHECAIVMTRAVISGHLDLETAKTLNRMTHYFQLILHFKICLVSTVTCHLDIIIIISMKLTAGPPFPRGPGLPGLPRGQVRHPRSLTVTGGIVPSRPRAPGVADVFSLINVDFINSSKF